MFSEVSSGQTINMTDSQEQFQLQEDEQEEIDSKSDDYLLEMINNNKLNINSLSKKRKRDFLIAVAERSYGLISPYFKV